MVALRLTKIAMAVGLLSLGLVAGCQSSKTTAAPKRDLPVVEAAPAPAPAPEVAPSPVPPTSVDLPPATESQPMDITIHPDKAAKSGKAAHAAKAGKTAKVAEAKAAESKAAPFTGKRDRTKWYLVVASAKDHAKYLDEYAAFLNKHGVSVTVEKRGDMFAVLSTQGFATGSTAEAKALKAKVVGLGKDYPGTKKGLWSDAYFLPPHSHKAAAATKPAAKK